MELFIVSGAGQIFLWPGATKTLIIPGGQSIEKFDLHRTRPIIKDFSDSLNIRT